MKTVLALILLLPGVLFGEAGPDLELASQTEFFTNLRYDYAKKPGTDFFPMWRLDPEHKALVAAYQKGEIEEVLRIAESWLRRCPVDADSHLRVAMCFKELGNLSSHNYHLAVFYGLLNSITSSGDGLTAESAYKVISVHEEYSLFQEIGAKLEQQTLVAGSVDKMEVSRKGGEQKLTLYFNVAIPLRAMGGQQK